MGRWLVALICTASALGISGASASRALSDTPARALITDGKVFAVAPVGNATYIGGDFRLIGTPTGAWVEVDGAGHPVSSRPFVEGTVDAAVGDGRGGWFLAGTIYAVGEVRTATTRLVHIKSNGTLDRGWRVSVRGGAVDDLVLLGRTLFIAGSFASVNGKARPSLAAVRTSKGSVLPWRPQGIPLEPKGKRRVRAEVYTLALSRDGRTLYLAGGFTQIGAIRRAGVAAVEASSGRVTAWNPSPRGSVYAIEPALGKRLVYLGGAFTRIGGAKRIALAAVDPVRGRATKFNAHAPSDAEVYDLDATPSVLYVAGSFMSFGGTSRHLVAAVDATNGSVTPWEAALSGDDATTIALNAQRTIVYVGGSITGTATARRDGLVALDAQSGEATAWDAPTLGDVRVIRPTAAGTVFVGGDLAFVGGLRRPGLALADASGAVTDWLPPINGLVRSLATSPDGSRVYVGGAFASADAPARRNLAVVDVASGSLRAFGDGTNSGVWAIAPTIDGSRLYIGGAFVNVGTTRRPHIAALDARDGSLLRWNSGANDLVRALVATGDGVYLGGDFTNAGGESRSRLVFLDGDTGRATGWNPRADDSAWALALAGGTLYAGGDFNQLGGKSRNFLGAVDIESGEATAWDPNADDTVRALRLSPDGTRLYAGGAFTKIGNVRRGYAEFALPSGTLTPWNPHAAWDAYAIGVAPDGFAVFGGAAEDLGGVDVFR